MTEQHAERRLVKHRLVGSCGLVARSRPRFSPAVSFELGGKGGFIAAVQRLPQLDLKTRGAAGVAQSLFSYQEQCLAATGILDSDEQYLPKPVSSHCFRDSITSQLRRPVHGIPGHWNKTIDLRNLSHESHQHSAVDSISRFDYSASDFTGLYSERTDLRSTIWDRRNLVILVFDIYMPPRKIIITVRYTIRYISASGNTMNSWVIFPLLVRRTFKSQSMTIADEKAVVITNASCVHQDNHINQQISNSCLAYGNFPGLRPRLSDCRDNDFHGNGFTVVQRTRTELMRSFLQKMKAKNTEATGWQVAKSVCLCFTSSSILVSDCLIKYILIACSFVVAMPSGKRETERKGNAPVNTGPSPNSDGRANNTVEEVNELVQGSDSLQLYQVNLA
ncbi:hypothetical protein T01_15804 [Trichinella spiralis]|uniref:Uncharacterized protein n=1 Tax=Trichinella spiralis TaxID=6334 RepID=A0A0V1ASC1_TRISP|nr:hypothetical protein T01_15804 [Trichinella spiralis]